MSELEKAEACLELWLRRADQEDEAIAAVVQPHLRMRDYYEASAEICREEIEKLKSQKA